MLIGMTEITKVKYAMRYPKKPVFSPAIKKRRLKITKLQSNIEAYFCFRKLYNFLQSTRNLS